MDKVLSRCRQLIQVALSVYWLEQGTCRGPENMELKNLPPVTIYVRTENYTVRGPPLLLCSYGPWSSGQAI